MNRTPSPIGPIHPLERPASPSRWQPYAKARGSWKDGQLNLRDIGGVFRRRWRSFAAGLGTVLALALLLTLLATPKYESTVTILVERPETGGDGVFAVLDRMSRGATKETEVRLLTSRRVVEPVVERLHLHVEFENGGRRVAAEELPVSLVSTGAATPGEFRVRSDGRHVRVSAGGSQGAVVEGAAGRLLSFHGLAFRVPEGQEGEFGVRVHPFSEAVSAVQEGHLDARVVHRDADLVELRCRSPYPEAARRLCSEVVSSYLELRTQLRQSEAVAASGFLENQVARLGAQLAAAEDSLEIYSRSALVVAPEQQAGEEVVQYSRLRAEKEALEAERLALARLLAEIEDGGERGSYRDLASFPTFLRNETVTRLVQSLVDLDNQRSELALRRAEDNPDLAAVDQRISQLEGQLHSLASSYEAALQTQIESIDGTLVGIQGRLTSLPTQRMEFERLQRRASLLEDLYRSLQARYQEAQVAAAVNLPSVRLVDAASLPIRPSSPRLRFNLGMGFALGLLVGLLLALYREEMDTRVKGLEDLASDTGLPVIALLPSVRKESRMRALPTGREVSRPSVGRVRAEDHERLVEGLRILLSELRLAERRGEVKSVAITSTMRGEGKTHVSSNLAFVAALDGQRVLLIDGDLRGRSVSQTFSAPEGHPGLGEVMRGMTAPSEAWYRVGAPGGGEVWILPAGRSDTHPVGSRENAELARAIEEARKEFDLVVVDSPPLGVVGDAAILASAVDGVLLVVRDAYTDRNAMALTLERLERTEARVLGIVFNDSEAREHYELYGYAETR